MKYQLFLLSLLISLSLFSQESGWMTYYEQSGNLETPRYAATMDFCKRLAAASKMITVTSFGKSSRGLELPLVILDKDGLDDPDNIRAAHRIIVLIQACIHPGECEGKDAGLMLFRDFVIMKKQYGLLDHLSILFIPIFNVDGHERFGPFNRINQNGPKEMGWRVNANNLNLNRDYLKADTPEMQSWLKLFSRWLPDFFIDTHTTDGADYQYVITYAMQTEGDMDPGLTRWAKEQFIKPLERSMEASGFPMFPYIDFRDWHDPQSGLVDNVSPPMLSQSYTSQRNRPGLLIETHMLKSYEQRVSATYQCLLNSLQILERESARLKETESDADHYSSGNAFRKDEFPLQYKTLENDSSMVEFLGIDYHMVKSGITGQTLFKYGTEKKTYYLPFYNKSEGSVYARLPEAYIVPAEWSNIINRLELHGIKIHRLKKDTVIAVSSFQFNNPKWQSSPYEGRHVMTNIEFDQILEIRTIPAGSAIVDMNQPASRIIAHLLEPGGNGSLVYWGFFDAIFEQKEYAEDYVMEEMAARMLQDNPGLRREFEEKKRSDTLFAKNPDLILHWFYTKTPYWDHFKDRYPVSKIFDRQVAAALLTL